MTACAIRSFLARGTWRSTPSAVRIVTSLSSDSNPIPAPAMSLTTTASRRLRSSFPRARSTGACPVLGREPDERLILAPELDQRAQHVFGSLELDLGDAVLLLELAVDRARWPEVRDGGAHQQHVGGWSSRRQASASSAAVWTAVTRAPGGGSSVTFAEITVTSAPRRAASRASANPIRPEDRLPT